MTAVSTGRDAEPGPVLTTSPWADSVIAFVFAASVVLFLLALITL